MMNGFDGQTVARLIVGSIGVILGGGSLYFQCRTQQVRIRLLSGLRKYEESTDSDLLVKVVNLSSFEIKIRRVYCIFPENDPMSIQGHDRARIWKSKNSVIPAKHDCLYEIPTSRWKIDAWKTVKCVRVETMCGKIVKLRKKRLETLRMEAIKNLQRLIAEPNKVP